MTGALGKIHFRKDSGNYLLDFRPLGRLYSNRGIPISDESTARRLLEQIRGKVADGRSLEEVLADYEPKDSATNLVPVWLERWLAVKRHETEAGERSPGYLRELERYARENGHFSWWQGRNIFEIDYGNLEDWSIWLGGRGIKIKTRQNVIGAFHSFVGWLVKREKLPRAPAFPWLKVPEHEPRIISPQQQDRVLQAIHEEERGIFLLMATTGVRPGEARALRASDHSEGWISVNKAAKGPRLDSPVGGTKSGKAKHVPLDPELSGWIDRYVAADARLTQAPLFMNPRTGNTWTPSSLRRTWRAACKKAGVGDISLYEGCKHSFATDAHARGVPERNLQAILGHADARSTRRYARLQGNALVEVLRPRDTAQPAADLSLTCPWPETGAAKIPISRTAM